ncbi:MAG: HisA/HisF-related TIM barrel protein [Planctomycetaceae bacterium]
MLLIPVLDLLGQQVVRGVAGRRDSYRPLESPLAKGSDPLNLAQAFRDRFGLNTLYVADLDAILARSPNWDVYRRLVADCFELLVDPGLRTADDAEPVFACGVSTVIAGLESLTDPRELDLLVEIHGASRLIFSLDLKQAEPICDRAAWEERSPLEIAHRAIDAGVTSILVLDLSQVGIGQGLNTLDLCRQIQQQHPTIRLFTGGGVRNRDDLNILQEQGIAGVLIASALHQGTVSADDCLALAEESP